MTWSLALVMRRYSVWPRDRIFVKGFEFLSFARNMGKDVPKNISKNLKSNYSQKLLDHAKKSATDVIKLLTKVRFKKQGKQLMI